MSPDPTLRTPARPEIPHLQTATEPDPLAELLRRAVDLAQPGPVRDWLLALLAGEQAQSPRVDK